MRGRFGNRGLRHRPICYTGRLGSFLCLRHYIKITVGDIEGLIYWNHQDLFIYLFIHSYIHSFIHPFILSVVSYYKSIASFKATSLQSAM